TSGVLTLTVLDQNTDAPIPDVSVVVSNVDSVVLQRGSTNAAGVFVSQELPGGVAYLRLSAPGYDTREYGVYIEGNVAESVTLMPLISGTLTITVTDAMNDQGIVGASVTITDIDESPIASGTTGAGGILVVESIPGGVVYIDVSAPGYQATEDYGVQIEGNTTATISLLPEDQPGTLTITVVDSGTDTPISGASVLLTYDNEEIASGTTNASGIFVTSQELEPRSYTLVITATGYVEWYGVATVYNGPAETEVRMQPVTEGVLTLTVIDGTTAAVIPNATVTVSRSETSEEYSGTTNSAGIYTSPTLSTGRYDIEVTADGYNPELYGSVDVDGDTS